MTHSFESNKKVENESKLDHWLSGSAMLGEMA